MRIGREGGPGMVILGWRMRTGPGRSLGPIEAVLPGRGNLMVGSAGAVLLGVVGATTRGIGVGAHGVVRGRMGEIVEFMGKRLWPLLDHHQHLAMTVMAIRHPER